MVRTFGHAALVLPDVDGPGRVDYLESAVSVNTAVAAARRSKRRCWPHNVEFAGSSARLGGPHQRGCGATSATARLEFFDGLQAPSAGDTGSGGLGEQRRARAGAAGVDDGAAGGSVGKRATSLNISWTLTGLSTILYRRCRHGIGRLEVISGDPEVLSA